MSYYTRNQVKGKALPITVSWQEFSHNINIEIFPDQQCTFQAHAMGVSNMWGDMTCFSSFYTLLLGSTGLSYQFLLILPKYISR